MGGRTSAGRDERAAPGSGRRPAASAGDQFAGRVGLFLRVDDFTVAYDRMCSMGVEFFSDPKQEPYGEVAIFVDLAGNRWDLLGPRPDAVADTPPI